MLLLGFKADWAKNLSQTRAYLSVWQVCTALHLCVFYWFCTLQAAYQQKLSVILLRLRGGCDFSSHIVDEEVIF